ncbi:MAG: hypothetical protein WDW38_005118 [Sanguina aurantia]
MEEGDVEQDPAATAEPAADSQPSQSAAAAAAMQEETLPADPSTNRPTCPAAVITTADSTIADESDLEAFGRLSASDRHMSPALRGVLAEVALTGRVRYQWCLMRPLVDFALEQVLIQYQPFPPEESNEMQYGPERSPSAGGVEDLQSTLARFRKMLSGFCQAPWTLQRFCELLLEPRKQYRVLRKVTLALERCLLITGELLPPSPSQIPALPLLSSLGPVNECSPNPHPSTATPTAFDGAITASDSPSTAVSQEPESSEAAANPSSSAPARSTAGGPDDGSASTHTLLDVRAPLPSHTITLPSPPLTNAHHGQHLHQQGNHHLHHAHPQQPQQQPALPGTAAAAAQAEANKHIEEDHWVESVPVHGSPQRSPNHHHIHLPLHAVTSPAALLGSARSGSISPLAPASPGTSAPLPLATHTVRSTTSTSQQQQQQQQQLAAPSNGDVVAGSSSSTEATTAAAAAAAAGGSAGLAGEPTEEGMQVDEDAGSADKAPASADVAATASADEASRETLVDAMEEGAVADPGSQQPPIQPQGTGSAPEHPPATPVDPPMSDTAAGEDSVMQGESGGGAVGADGAGQAGVACRVEGGAQLVAGELAGRIGRARCKH